ncbi:hypothetical protein ANN_05673 [Periplaneta americana]|uniref:Uncharacterized protein n=1 Tax=Periplaneta americana TaxID=6978 RepID=A0ABQ8TCS1_PERAM|nr:hypothetical protein ANN_05673 [Periplaneta americana]
MAGLCEGGNEPSGSLKASNEQLAYPSSSIDKRGFQSTLALTAAYTTNDIEAMKSRQITIANQTRGGRNMHTLEWSSPPNDSGSQKPHECVDIIRDCRAAMLNTCVLTSARARPGRTWTPASHPTGAKFGEHRSEAQHCGARPSSNLRQ